MLLYISWLLFAEWKWWWMRVARNCNKAGRIRAKRGAKCLRHTGKFTLLLNIIIWCLKSTWLISFLAIQRSCSGIFLISRANDKAKWSSASLSFSILGAAVLLCLILLARSPMKASVFIVLSALYLSASSRTLVYSLVLCYRTGPVLSCYHCSVSLSLSSFLDLIIIFFILVISTIKSSIIIYISKFAFALTIFTTGVDFIC